MNHDKWAVYIHTNKTNNKKYVGITSSCPPSKRWGYNGINYRGCIKFWNAIKKYGWNNFEHDILFTNLTMEEANAKEKELIAKYDTMHSGYNQEPGGILQGPRSIEAIEKIKKARAKQIITPEMVEKGASKRRGRKHSQEWCDNIRKGKWDKSRDVMCIETNTVYSCIAEASKITGIGYGTIRNSADRHERNIPSRNRGLHWKYM